METLQNEEENTYNDELSYQDKNWKVATAHKKHKIIPGTSAMKISDTEKQQWLQDIPLYILYIYIYYILYIYCILN